MAVLRGLLLPGSLPMCSTGLSIVQGFGLQVQLDLSSTCCRSCRQQIVVHVQPGAAAEPASAPPDSSPLPSLPQHVLSRSGLLHAAARQAAQDATAADSVHTGDSGSAGSKHGLTPEQLRRRMRESIADLLLDDSDGD